MLRVLIIACCILFAGSLSAQDTFYVKKKQTPVPGGVKPAAVQDWENDSIVSYTMEYQKPGTNTWVLLHLLGPYLTLPAEVYTKDGGTRVWFRDIIAVDANGKKYKQPDRLWKSGVWVTLDQQK